MCPAVRPLGGDGCMMGEAWLRISRRTGSDEGASGPSASMKRSSWRELRGWQACVTSRT